MNRATFQRKEREISKAVEPVVRATCVDTKEQEKHHAIEIASMPDENNILSVSCSSDMGWQNDDDSTTGSYLHAQVPMGYKSLVRLFTLSDH